MDDASVRVGMKKPQRNRTISQYLNPFSPWKRSLSSCMQENQVSAPPCIRMAVRTVYIYMLSIEMVYLMSVPSCQWSRARRPETYPRSHRSNRGGRRDCDVELWRGLRLPEWRSCWWRWCRCAWSPRAARWEAHLGRLGLHCLRPRIRHCYSRLPSQSLLWRIGRGQTMR